MRTATLFSPHAALLEVSAPTQVTDTVEQLHRSAPWAAFLIIGPSMSFNTAIRAMRAGVRDWLITPVSGNDILRALGRVLFVHRVSPIDPAAPGIEPHASARLAEKAVLFMGSETDQVTLAALGRTVGVSAGCLRNWCRMARLSARAFREFTRALRAVHFHERHPAVPVESILNIVDRRTLSKFLLRCGGTNTSLPPTVEEFLTSQQYLQTPEWVVATRRALQRRPKAGSNCHDPD